MQMQVQVAVDMIQGQAGGAESLELRVDFGAKLRAQAALEKIMPGRSRPVGWRIRRGH